MSFLDRLLTEAKYNPALNGAVIRVFDDARRRFNEARADIYRKAMVDLRRGILATIKKQGGHKPLWVNVEKNPNRGEMDIIVKVGFETEEEAQDFQTSFDGSKVDRRHQGDFFVSPKVAIFADELDPIS